MGEHPAKEGKMYCSNCKKEQLNDVYVHGLDLCPKCEHFLMFGSDLLEACREAYQLLFQEYGNSEHTEVMNILKQAITLGTIK